MAATFFIPLDQSLMTERTYLTAAASAGATSVTVKSTTGFTTQDNIIVGEVGKEGAELSKVNGTVSSQTSLATTALLSAHSVNEPVTIFLADFIKVYGCATRTGTYALVNSYAVNQMVDDTGGFYFDYTGSTYRYFKVVYYHTTLTLERPSLADAEIIDGTQSGFYTTMSAYKRYAGITGTDQDDEIYFAIKSWTAAINGYLFGDATQTLLSSTYTDYVPVPVRNTDMLMVNHSPISSVTSITVDGVSVYPGTHDVEHTDGYIIYLSDGLSSGGPGSRLNATVVYTAGYSSVPADVELACQKLVSYSLNKDLRDSAGLRSYSIGTKRVEYDTSAQSAMNQHAIPPSIQSILAPYRRSSSLIYRYQ